VILLGHRHPEHRGEAVAYHLSQRSTVPLYLTAGQDIEFPHRTVQGIQFQALAWPERLA
jgi:hypothetical protein